MPKTSKLKKVHLGKALVTGVGYALGTIWAGNLPGFQAPDTWFTGGWWGQQTLSQ